MPVLLFGVVILVLSVYLLLGPFPSVCNASLFQTRDSQTKSCAHSAVLRKAATGTNHRLITRPCQGTPWKLGMSVALLVAAALD